MPNERSRAARIDAWVDFPVPSPPSKVMKRPRISPPLLASPSGFFQPHPVRARAQAAIYIRLAAERNRLITSSDAASMRALRDRACRDAFGGLQRHLQHFGIAAPDLQIADRLSLPHRRPDRSGIDHLGDDLVADAARHHQLDRALGGDRDAALRAAINLGLGHVLAFGEQDPGSRNS